MNESALQMLDNERLSGKIVYTTIVAALGAFLDGYDLAIIGGAFLFLKSQWHLTPAQMGVLGSLAFVGMIVGALVFGRVTDKFGRRSAFMIDLALFVIGGLICALATNVLWLEIGRFLVGFGIGADIPISTSLIAEISPKNKRGFLTGLMQAFWFGGALFSAVVSILFANGSPDSWRWLLGSGVLVAVVIMLLRSKALESPRWLLSQGRTEDAKQVLAEVVERSGDVRQASEESSHLHFSALFTKKYAASLFLVCLFWFLVTIRGAAFVVYTPALLLTFGLTSKTASFEMNAILFAVYTVVSVISAVYIDKMGRRSIVLWGWALATLITLIMAFVGSSTAIALFVLLLLSTVPIQTVTVALFPWSVEFFPTSLRASAQSFASASGKLGGLVATLFFPIVLAAVGWGNTVFIFFAIMLLGLIIGFAVKPEETRNRSLEDISVERSLL